MMIGRVLGSGLGVRGKHGHVSNVVLGSRCSTIVNGICTLQHPVVAFREELRG
jgi:hypothetical protein